MNEKHEQSMEEFRQIFLAMKGPHRNPNREEQSSSEIGGSGEGCYRGHTRTLMKACGQAKLIEKSLDLQDTSNSSGSQPVETQLVDNKQIQKLIQKSAQLAIMVVTMVTIRGEDKAPMLKSQEVSIPRGVQQVIDRYSPLFEAHTTLPSHKMHNHMIVL
ncbi:hypothetical protein RND71_023227 [Anisodus tanguticus]|uniref:Uncharacterized protein n=1 Tax=Anisodus tanguticus TaxID=243964 RepID=A0AAE1RV50_9SOLA|nr:hypothetical protein RND71_023227 [Anisodus tanguticus]